MKNPLSQISTENINLLNNDFKKTLENCNSALDNVYEKRENMPEIMTYFLRTKILIMIRWKQKRLIANH